MCKSASQRLTDIYNLGARLGAVHNGVTLVHGERVLKLVKPLLRVIVPCVRDPTTCLRHVNTQLFHNSDQHLHQSSGAEVLVAVPPVTGA